MEKLASEFRHALDTAVLHAISHIETLDQSSVAATVDVETLRSRLARPLTDAAVPANQVIDDLARDVEGGLIGSAGGRFFGWVIGDLRPGGSHRGVGRS